MTINLTELNDSPYLSSADFAVGTILPPLTVESVTLEDVPVAGSKKTNRKGIVRFVGAKKGWCMNKNEARKIAAAIGEAKDLGTTWVGATIQLKVVGDVRRPDGTRGNAFRVHAASKTTTQPTTEPKEQA